MKAFLQEWKTCGRRSKQVAHWKREIAGNSGQNCFCRRALDEARDRDPLDKGQMLRSVYILGAVGANANVIVIVGWRSVRKSHARYRSIDLCSKGLV